MVRQVQGNPVHCGMCGKPVLAGLIYGGKPAKQAMTPVGAGRMHIDRDLCRALERMTDDEFAAISKTRSGSDGRSRRDGSLYPVDGMGVDRGIGES